MVDEPLNLLLEAVDFGRHITDEVTRSVGDRVPLGNHALLLCCRLEIEGDLRVKELAELSSVSSGRVTQVVGELTEVGLLETRRDRADGRATVVSLTDDGHAFVHAVSDALARSLRNDPEPLERFTRAVREALAKVD